TAGRQLRVSIRRPPVVTRRMWSLASRSCGWPSSIALAASRRASWAAVNSTSRAPRFSSSWAREDARRHRSGDPVTHRRRTAVRRRAPPGPATDRTDALSHRIPASPRRATR
ncbi:hypothetical protein ACWDE9_12685, partial [Streptomyces olivaceoviridis]